MSDTRNYILLKYLMKHEKWKVIKIYTFNRPKLIHSFFFSHFISSLFFFALFSRFSRIFFFFIIQKNILTRYTLTLSDDESLSIRRLISISRSLEFSHNNIATWTTLNSDTRSPLCTVTAKTRARLASTRILFPFVSRIGNKAKSVDIFIVISGQGVGNLRFDLIESWRTTSR